MTAEGRRWVELDLGVCAAELSPPDRGRSSFSRVFQLNAEQLFPSLRSMCVFNTAALRSNCSCKHNPHKLTNTCGACRRAHTHAKHVRGGSRAKPRLTDCRAALQLGNTRAAACPNPSPIFLTTYPKSGWEGLHPGQDQHRDSQFRLWTNHVSGLV